MVNPTEPKVREVARTHRLNEDGFERVARLSLKVWPLLP